MSLLDLLSILGPLASTGTCVGVLLGLRQSRLAECEAAKRAAAQLEQARRIAGLHQCALLEEKLHFAARVVLDPRPLGPDDDAKLFETLAAFELIWQAIEDGLLDIKRVNRKFGKRIVDVLGNPYVRAMVDKGPGAENFDFCERLRSALVEERRQTRQLVPALANAPISG